MRTSYSAGRGSAGARGGTPRARAEAAKVGLIARRKEQLDTLAGEVAASGGTAAAAAADVGDRAQVQAAVDEVRRRLGPVDLLVANAGVGAPTLFDPMNVGDVEKM